MKRAFVTGAAGFIGSNLVDRLLANQIEVIGWDNFSTGQLGFVADAVGHAGFKLVRGDNLDLPALKAAMNKCDTVFHLAANADVRHGNEHPQRDFEQNTLATFNVLEAARANGVNRIAFSSTGSVYGESKVIPTPEGAPFPIQTSHYGASKLAGEGLLGAYAEGYGIEAYIFRFVSILGERYTHGHLFDFYRQLVAHPNTLHILGDGTQRKSYLYVQDCIDAMLHVMAATAPQDCGERVKVYNLGSAEFVDVNTSVKVLCSELGLTPTLTYSGGKRGWIGDNPFIFLDTNKIQATGWRPKLTIQQGISRTLHWFQNNPWVFEARANK